LFNNINEIKVKTQQQIKKLKEAKQSLISEAVTGKIDLRDWEIIETGGR
jgi:type I restriction enzyme S subunit